MAKKKKNEKQSITKKHLDLFYMTPKIIHARDIYDVLKENNSISIELWDEMNVLEIRFSNGNQVDIEPMEPEFENPFDNEFIINRNIKSIFAVTICEDDVEEVKTCFETIIKVLEGFLCTDSDDFSPFYVG